MKFLIFLSLVIGASAQAANSIRPLSYQTAPNMRCEPGYDEVYKSTNCCKAVTYEFESASYVTRFCMLSFDAMYLDAVEDAIENFKSSNCDESARWSKRMIEISNKKNNQSVRARHLLWNLNTKRDQLCAHTSGSQHPSGESTGIN